MWWGTRSKLQTKCPVTLNLFPSWWNRNYGITYGMKIFENPEYRAQTFKEMNRLAWDRFGDVGFGEEEADLVWTLDDLNNATMPAILGCEVVYPDDNYAVARPLSEEQIMTLNAPEDISSIWPISEIIRQTEYINAKYDQNPKPGWAYMGVQNIASITRGVELYSDYYLQPSLARHLLDISTDMIIDSVEYFRDTGSEISVVCNQNCTVPLCGPRVYEEFLLDYEKQLFQYAKSIEAQYYIHHCGILDTYLQIYNRIENIHAFDIGWGSDLRLALDAYPKSSFNYIIGHTFIMQATATEARDMALQIIDTAGPDINRLSVIFSDLEHQTPDENIKAFTQAFAG